MTLYEPFIVQGPNLKNASYSPLYNLLKEKQIFLSKWMNIYNSENNNKYFGQIKSKYNFLT